MSESVNILVVINLADNEGYVIIVVYWELRCGLI